MPGSLNGRQFPTPQFEFIKAEPRSMDGPRMHTVRATVAGEHAGAIQWSPKSGEIHNIDVHPDYQRQGVATSLLGQARQVAEGTRGVKPPRHSPERTDAGEAWARSTGDRLPRRM